jgi:hypothetical protein
MNNVVLVTLNLAIDSSVYKKGAEAPLSYTNLMK